MMKPNSHTPTSGLGPSAPSGLSARVTELGQSIEDGLSTSFNELAVLRRAFAMDLKAALGPGGAAERAGAAARAVRSELEALAARDTSAGDADSPIQAQSALFGAVLARLESDLAEGDGHGAVRKVTQRSPAVLSKLITILQVRDEAAQRVDHIVSGLALGGGTEAAGLGIILRSLMVGLAEVLRARAVEATDSLGVLDDLVQEAFAVVVDRPRPDVAGVVAALDATREAFGALVASQADMPPATREDIARLMQHDGAFADLHAAMDALSQQGGTEVSSAATILLGAGPILTGLRDKMGRLQEFADQLEELAAHLNVAADAGLPEAEDALDALWNLYTMDAERELHKAAVRSAGG